MEAETLVELLERFIDRKLERQQLTGGKDLYLRLAQNERETDEVRRELAAALKSVLRQN